LRDSPVPAGVRAVVAETLAVKHQLLIMKRSQRRAPNLTSWDRLMLGFYPLLVSPKRLRKIAVITKPSTLLRLHQALVKRKYHLLYSSQRTRRPGPKGPSGELIAAVVEMKQRNPRMGCRKIAEQISNVFGLAINKDVVRRILIEHFRPAPGGDGPSWLSVIGQARDSLWSVDLFRCESILLRQFSPRFGLRIQWLAKKLCRYGRLPCNVKDRTHQALSPPTTNRQERLSLGSYPGGRPRER
jgi:putative transposase